MNSLARFSILISAVHGRLAEPTALILQRAGACIQICSPQLDLWATLADQSFDAIVVVVGPDDEAPLAPYAPIHDDPRARDIPCLLLIDPTISLSAASMGTLHCVTLLASDCDELHLLQAVTGLVESRRRMLEYETAVRELAEGLRNETQRADALAKKLGNVAHDVRGMLAVAYGFSCNLRDGVVDPGSEAERTHVNRILQAIEGSTHLLESLAQSAPRATPSAARRLSSLGTQRVQRSLVQVGRLAREVVLLLEQKAAQQKVQLIGDIDENVSVWGDALKIKQVLVNLVDNAIKYGSRGGEVSVRVQWSHAAFGSGKRSRRSALITVSDRGPGIAPEFHERVFERGFRGSQKDPGTGQGIGLHLVREIVVQHGGSVECCNGDETGAVFHVSLPADLRERERPGLLILRDTPACNALARVVETTRAMQWQSISAENDVELGRLTRECAAIVLMPTSDEPTTEEFLAQLGRTPS